MTRIVPSLLALISLGCCGAPPGILYEPPAPPPPPPSADGAGNWTFPAIYQHAGPGEIDRNCTQDRQMCVALRHTGGWALTMSEGGDPTHTVAVWPEAPPDVFFGLSSPIVREVSGAWLVGVERSAYGDRASGGWYSRRSLLLYRVERGASEARQVLDVPISAMRSIRLCRSGSRHRPPETRCIRDFNLSSTFGMDPETPAGPPRFILASQATIFPGPHAPAPGPGVTPAMMTEADPACSYRRMYIFDTISGRYVADAPLPACADYFGF